MTSSPAGPSRPAPQAGAQSVTSAAQRPLVFPANTPIAPHSTGPISLLSRSKFPYHALWGDWHIVGSSLPLWQGRSDVVVRYTDESPPSPPTTPMERQVRLGHASQDETAHTEPVEVRFCDAIWYEVLDQSGKVRPGKGATRGGPTIIKGRNVLDPRGVNAATFSWRGFKWLKPFTAQWQVIGYSSSFGQEPATEDWIITYFTATLFTPAGIDIYARSPDSLSDAMFARIVEELRTGGAVCPVAASSAAQEELRKLAADIFRIPHGVEQAVEEEELLFEAEAEPVPHFPGAFPISAR